MLDIPSISAIVAAIGVIIGVVFTVLQLRDLVKTRQTDLVIRLYTTFGSKEYLEAYSKVVRMEFRDYNDFMEKYGWTDVNQVGLLFEGIGVLLRRKLINVGLVDDLFTGPIKLVWNKIKPVIEVAREKIPYPQLYEWFEYLYNEMQKREQQLASKTA